jgi:uncharacterized repeat protein (TIGR02543 family)
MDITWSDPSRIHSVSYELHGGTAYGGDEPLAGGIPTVKAITGAKITAPSTVVKKQYYVFDGWYQDAEGTIPWKFDTDQVTGDLVLHAKWKPESYHITYELDGGTNDEKNPVTYTIEDTVKLENPVKPGYQFLGWNTEQDGTGTTVTEIPAGSSGAKTFYARWTPLEQSYEIHHMLQTLNGNAYEDKDTVTAKAYTGTEVTIGTAQSRVYEGFTFDTSKTDDSKGTIPGEGTLVLKLYYSRNSYAVTFESGTGDTVETQNIAYEGKVAKPSELTKVGYQFTGWYLTGDPSRLWNFDNDVVTGTTELRAGYQFAGYYDRTEGGTQYYNADGSSAKTWDKTEDSTLYAHWTANSYQVTFDANGGEGSMNAEDFTYGEAKALTQNTFTRTGYTFAGWATTANAGEAEHEDGKNVSNLTTEQNGTVNLYAVWKPVVYMVIFNSNGADGGNMENQTFTYDTAASLRGNGYTKTGYHFLGWAKTASAQVTYTDGASVNNLTATADDRITLYAVWEANTYTVRFNANGGTGDQIEGWYTTQKTDGTQVTSLTLMSTPQNHTLYARWRKIEKTTVTVGEVTLTYEGTPVYAKPSSDGVVTEGGSSSDYNIMFEEGELTLKNATICSSTDRDGAIHTTNALVIKLEGKNTVTSAKSEYGIYVQNNKLNIQGNGSLEVTAGTGGNFSDAIYVGSGIVIDGATVTATGRNATQRSRGICVAAGGTVTMQNGAYVTAVGGIGGESYGIWSGSVIINNSSGSAKASDSATGQKQAIYINSDGQPKLTNATVTSGSYSDSFVQWTKQQ